MNEIVDAVLWTLAVGSILLVWWWLWNVAIVAVFKGLWLAFMVAVEAVLFVVKVLGAVGRWADRN